MATRGELWFPGPDLLCGVCSQRVPRKDCQRHLQDCAVAAGERDGTQHLLLEVSDPEVWRAGIPCSCLGAHAHSGGSRCLRVPPRLLLSRNRLQQSPPSALQQVYRLVLAADLGATFEDLDGLLRSLWYDEPCGHVSQVCRSVQVGLQE